MLTDEEAFLELCLDGLGESISGEGVGYRLAHMFKYYNVLDWSIRLL